jgi:hypothetical protein
MQKEVAARHLIRKKPRSLESGLFYYINGVNEIKLALCHSEMTH